MTRDELVASDSRRDGPPLVELERRLTDWASRQFGLRILASWGIRRLGRIAGLFVRIAVLSVWALLVAQAVPANRPDLLRPAEFGSDSSNYVAAGERLAAGGDLYQLVAGDRPASADNPPDWTVPILSPPTAAAPWAVIRVLPEPVGLAVPWLGGMLAVMSIGVVLIARGPALMAAASVPLLPALALTAWSGNINAWIVAGAVLAWLMGTGRISPRLELMGGAFIGLLTVAKFGPAYLGLFLLAAGRYRAVAAAVAMGLALAAIVFLLGGIQPFIRYLDVVRDATATPTALSVPGITLRAGFPLGVGNVLLVVLVVVCCALIVLRRRRPPISFAFACLGLAVAVPQARIETLALILLVIAPFAFEAPRGGSWRAAVTYRTPIALLVGAFSTAAAVVAVLAASPRSTVVITNETSTAALVRFKLSGQSATFGYHLPPGVTGFAWRDRAGFPAGPFVAFDGQCRHIASGGVAADGGHIVLRPGRAPVVKELPAVDSRLTHLRYSSDCAREARSASAATAGR